MCLGYTVYRGSVKAKELAPALWIDFHDEEHNPYGYQRPFDDKRSQRASDYAIGTEKAFWPESILAIRTNSDVDEEADKVYWEFLPTQTDSDFGKLVVQYNETRTELIVNKNVNWRRAFSQVDCQHRLGHMAESDKHVTVCVIPDLTRLEEAVIFKTINDTQKKISTSLVDAIVLLSSTSKEDAPEIHWAYDLGTDCGSSLFRLVSSEGTNLKGLDYLVTLRTLRTCIASLVGGKRQIRKYIEVGPGYDDVYVFLRNYWLTIRELWPTEFQDNKNYKLMIVPGLKGLSRFGRGICEKALEVGDTRQDFIRPFFGGGPNMIDWSVTGPLQRATGNAGAGMVFEVLVNAYGKP